MGEFISGLLSILPQAGALGAIVFALVWLVAKYLDHKPAWSKSLLDQQNNLAQRIDKMQERIDALETERAARETAFLKLRYKFYGMASRVTLLEGLLRANGIPVPEYDSELDLHDDEFEYPRITDEHDIDAILEKAARQEH